MGFPLNWLVFSAPKTEPETVKGNLGLGGTQRSSRLKSKGQHPEGPPSQGRATKRCHHELESARQRKLNELHRATLDILSRVTEEQQERGIPSPHVTMELSGYQR